MGRIRGAVVVILGLALLLSVTGCASIAQQATKSAVENATGIKVDESSGKTTITGKDGSQATLSGGDGKLPEGLPAYMPVYDGAVKSGTVITTDKGSNYTFVVLTDDSAQTVLDWYKQQLTDQGWTVTATVMNGEDGMVSAKKGETDNAVVTVSKNSDGKTEVAAIVDVKK